MVQEFIVVQSGLVLSCYTRERNACPRPHVLAARCTYESWGFMLHRVSPQLFELQLDILKRDGIRSMLDIARDHDIDKNAILYHTPLRFVDFVEHRLRFSLDMEDCYSNLRRDINRH